jgi:hypothetical protein
MPLSTQATVDPAKPFQASVVSESPHVVSYRLWYEIPGGTWQVFGDGGTDDNAPDVFVAGPVPKGSQVAYWLGIGGNPNTAYRAVVQIAQDSGPVSGGKCVEEGNADAVGTAVCTGTILLQ